jgi:DNA repair protein RecN (Recombination protein N)
MLRFLSIRHFAIIEQVELEFGPGFTVISGETGAGKSILIDALGLLLGERASSGQVADGANQADLSAEFELEHQPAARQWLQEQAMDENGQLLLRRVLSAEGGSRAWINGRSATIGQLAELGERLVEIHGQHEHQLLARPNQQRAILDRQVDPSVVSAVREAFSGWQRARAEIDEFERDCGDPGQFELLQFQHRELESLQLQPGEYESMELEQERLARSDEIRACLERTRAALVDESGPNVRDLLRRARLAMEQVSALDPDLGEILGLLEEAGINVDEALTGLERCDQPEEENPQALDQLNRRLEKCLDLARKHRIRPEQSPTLADELGERLDRLTHQDDRRQALESRLAAAASRWQTAADQLSEKRRQAAAELSSYTGEKLAELGMTRAALSVEVKSRPRTAPAEYGQDEIEFQFSANAGQTRQALHKVASGGELSRISLALMIAARAHSERPARVFDEVDAGIGGETAHVVGSFLRQASAGGQAFCVTHLAQVAARADHQFRVTKREHDGRTLIGVEQLDRAGREEELARMLGNRQSAGSLAHAREMLDAS